MTLNLGKTCLTCGNPMKKKRFCSFACRVEAQRKYSPDEKALMDTWRGMKARCFKPLHTSYPNYGGRGISVCEEWARDFKTFAAYVLRILGPRPAGASIDRINNDGNYEPGNIRWASSKEQQRNRRACWMVNAFGRSATITEWSERSGLGIQTIWGRLQGGWDPEVAVSKPSRVKIWRSSPGRKKGVAA